MPNRELHEIIGSFTGLVAAIDAAKGQSQGNLCLEAMGGYLTGRFVATLPDVIDPPTDPLHRCIGHGVVPNSAFWVSASSGLDQLTESFRNAAEQSYKRMMNPASPPAVQIFEGVMVVFFRIAAGSASAVLPAYLSHLALDMTTKRGLPLIGRGF